MIKKLLCTFLLFTTFTTFAQVLTWSPQFPTESTSNLVITADATKGNQGLFNYNPFDVYVHIGVITNLSTGPGDWRHVQSSWGTTNAAFKATPTTGTSRWTFTINSPLRSYFNITDPNEKILKIAILFRDGAGNRKLANADGSDMYEPIYTSDLAVKITKPPFQATYKPIPETITKTVGDDLEVTAQSNVSSDMKIYLNGNPVNTASGVTSISSTVSLVTSGNQQIVAEAISGGKKTTDTLNFFVSGSVNIAPLPTGVKPGINYINNTSATLVLYAPGKGRVGVIGDLPGSNWSEQSQYQMNKTPDGNYWWITLTNLTPGTEYGFQYLVNGTLRIADPYSEKILDPYNDQYITSDTYPGLKPYPTSLTSEVVGILQTAKPAYNWSSSTFTKPDKRNLIIYELLVRDFVEKHDWKTLRDTLNYLKTLGVNAIEIMPFNEFEGNNSWGYNPDFYFAPDKEYGPANTLKEFIDSCHKNGIAVIMDIALNHSFGMSPMVRLYWDAAKNRPADDNPWFNPVAKHAFNVGYDMNHESAQTKYFVSRVVSHWMNEYKIDGFRFDLSKGFTQKQTCDNSGNNCDVGAWSAYDQSRIDIWKAYYDTLQKYSPGSYCILEHFADNSEETVLSNYGMMLWGNMNYNYNQATMGYNTDWNFSYGIANQRGWSNPYLVTYMESHDEERLMYKNLQYGNNYTGTPPYNVKALDTALQRQQLAAAFFLTLPGPKMIWQFGELGYDYSINYCQDGTVNGNCRTDKKPIRWDYYQQANRKKLFDVYRHLINLRKNPLYTSAFISNSSQQDLSGVFKWIKLNGPQGKLVVIGNFDVVAQSGSVTFPSAGTWYDYLNGTTITATGSAQAFNLKPGEFRVYTSTVVALPVTIIGFSGTSDQGQNVLNWKVADEKNLASYEVQRSTDGIYFETIGNVIPDGSDSYFFTDKQAGPIAYYRVRMTDKDGSSALSNVIVIRQSATLAHIVATPNPFVNNIKVTLESPIAQSATFILTTIEGKQLIQKKVNVTAGKNEIAIPEAGNLSSGMYFLKTIMGAQSQIIRVIKQK